MSAPDKESVWNNLANRLMDVISNLGPQTKESQTITFKNIKDVLPKYLLSSSDQQKEEAQWAIIHKHSLAKFDKVRAEQYYAPMPLPPQLRQSLHERIETSRNQLMKLLREQDDIFNDQSFVI